MMSFNSRASFFYFFPDDSSIGENGVLKLLIKNFRSNRVSLIKLGTDMFGHVCLELRYPVGKFFRIKENEESLRIFSD